MDSQGGNLEHLLQSIQSTDNILLKVTPELVFLPGPAIHTDSYWRTLPERSYFRKNLMKNAVQWAKESGQDLSAPDKEKINEAVNSPDFPGSLAPIYSIIPHTVLRNTFMGNMSEARQELYAQMMSWGFDDIIADTTNRKFEEAIQNNFRHGNGGDASRRVYASVSHLVYPDYHLLFFSTRDGGVNQLKDEDIKIIPDEQRRHITPKMVRGGLGLQLLYDNSHLLFVSTHPTGNDIGVQVLEYGPQKNYKPHMVSQNYEASGAMAPAGPG